LPLFHVSLKIFSEISDAHTIVQETVDLGNAAVLSVCADFCGTSNPYVLLKATTYARVSAAARKAGEADRTVKPWSALSQVSLAYGSFGG
jgi:hypothetical protein